MENDVLDCRSKEGITVGLIDAIITICRILSKRELSGIHVKEALEDLYFDEDFRFVNHVALLNQSRKSYE